MVPGRLNDTNTMSRRGVLHEPLNDRQLLKRETVCCRINSRDDMSRRKYVRRRHRHAVSIQNILSGRIIYAHTMPSRIVVPCLCIRPHTMPGWIFLHCRIRNPDPMLQWLILPAILLRRNPLRPGKCVHQPHITDAVQPRSIL